MLSDNSELGLPTKCLMAQRDIIFYLFVLLAIRIRYILEANVLG
jgi:hypothetical protein